MYLNLYWCPSVPGFVFIRKCFLAVPYLDPIVLMIPLQLYQIGIVFYLWNIKRLVRKAMSNVRLRFLYRQYIISLIFRFVSQHCLPYSTLYAFLILYLCSFYPVWWSTFSWKAWFIFVFEYFNKLLISSEN